MSAGRRQYPAFGEYLLPQPHWQEIRDAGPVPVAIETTCGAAVDGAAATTGVLSDVRCHTTLPQLGDALTRVVVLVASQRAQLESAPARLIDI